jgi:hypothetical protein
MWSRLSDYRYRYSINPGLKVLKHAPTQYSDRANNPIHNMADAPAIPRLALPVQIMFCKKGQKYKKVDRKFLKE